MTDALKKLCNLLLRDGITEEAFDTLCEVVYNDVNDWNDKREKAREDLINRTKKVHYPHGYRIEFRDGGEYEGV